MKGNAICTFGTMEICCVQNYIFHQVLTHLEYIQPRSMKYLTNCSLELKKSDKFEAIDNFKLKENENRDLFVTVEDDAERVWLNCTLAFNIARVSSW